MISHILVVVLLVWTLQTRALQITDKEYSTLPTLFPTDDYDLCMLTGDKALYCYIYYELQPLNKTNPAPLWKQIEAVSSSPANYRHDIIRHFMCVTSKCPEVSALELEDTTTKENIKQCLNKQYEHMGLEGAITRIKCRTNKPEFQIDTLDYVTMTVFVIYISFVIITSFYDLYQRYDTIEKYTKFQDTRVGKFTRAFSIPNNWNKLKSDNKSAEAEKLRCVQGIRVYMTFLVVLVHTVTSLAVAPVANPYFIEKMNDLKPYVSEFPKRGIYILSFHFMMSTWVLMNSMLAKSDKNEPIDIIFVLKSIIKRYIRFIPCVVLIVGFYATWYRHIPFGPFWDGVCDESYRCRKNWWTNILFVQSYIDPYYMCHIVSWYIGIEMQYYILSLIFIMLMHKTRSKIPIVLIILLPINIGLAFWDHYRHRYPSTLSSNPEDVYNLKFNTEPQWHDHFASYHANFAGSIIGLIYGYFFYIYKDKKIFTSKVSIVLWWILSFGLLGIVVTGPQFINVDKTPFYSALWVALIRPIFALGIGLMIFGMSHGIGGFVKWIFEWEPLYALAKLSYTVYIGHTVFQSIRVGFTQAPVHINYYSLFSTALSDIVLAFAVAVFLTLFFEMPSNDLANMLFKTKKPEQKRKVK